jgi:dynein heavy chain
MSRLFILYSIFQGELTITADMEELGNAMFLDGVPDSWVKRAYPSLYGLGLWYSDLIQRIKELESWTADFQLPACVWLAGFFNPQSFLTAIMQQMARKNEWPLDKMTLQCDVTKRNKEDMAGAPREGAYVHGLYMEGARWDVQTGMINEARLKELNPKMPVIFIKAIPVDRQDLRNIYECPV